MKKIFKIVRSNGYNSDQDLMSFFDDWSKAEQIKDESNGYLAVDDTEIGHAHRIPLWMFGLLY